MVRQSHMVSQLHMVRQPHKVWQPHMVRYPDILRQSQRVRRGMMILVENTRLFSYKTLITGVKQSAFDSNEKQVFQFIYI